MDNNTRPAAAFTLAPPAALPAPLLDRTVATDLATDFALPDYLPEIKRLLRVTPAVLPESRYLGASSAEFSGAVEYLVTYAGADGNLWSTRLRQDYAASTPVDADQLARGLDPAADTQVDSVVSRVTGPRKLNMRARLRTHVHAWGDEPVEPEIDGNPSPASLERLTKPCRAMRLLRAASEPIDLGDEIPLADGAGETRVIRADGCVNVTDATVGDGTVTCRGELILQLLTCVEQDGMVSEPEVTLRKLPFEEQLALPEAAPGMAARAWGRCGDLAVQIEDGRILCDATMWLEAEAAGEAELALTADLYATDGEIEDANYREIEVSSLARCANGSFTMTGVAPLKEAGIDPAAEIVDVAAEPQIESMELANGRCKLNGSCRLSVIYRLDGEYGAGEMVLPLAYTVDCGEAMVTDHAVEMTVCGLRTRCEGDGDARRLSVDAEIAAATRLFARQKQRILARAAYRPSDAAREAACVVCYPEPGDSIWSICKRYRVSCAKVASANHLQPGEGSDLPASLEGVQYLLI